MRSFAVASCLALACLGFSQDRSMLVSFNTRATRASVVVKQLAEMTKVNLQTSPQTENEILVISVKDVPLSELMDKIAIATSGDWRKEGGLYRLVSNSLVRRQEENTEAAKRFADVKKAIADRDIQQKKMKERFAKMVAEQQKKAAAAAAAAKKDGKKGKEEDEADAELPDMPTEGPDEVAIGALLRELDVTPIATMEAGERVVYATDPNKTQHPLGPNASEAINAFIKAHNDSVTDLPPDSFDNTNGMDAQQAEMMQRMMKRQNSKIGAVAKVLLVVSDSGFGMMMGLTLEMRFYDAKGNILYTGNGNLSLNGENPFMAAMADGNADDSDGTPKTLPPPKQQKPPVKRTPIVLSEDTKALQDGSKGMMTGTSIAQFKPDLKKKLLNPAVYDPLSFLDTDEVFAYGASKQRPLVADLPDGEDSMFGMFSTAGQLTSLEEVTESIEKGKSMVAVPDDSFTIIKPARPVRARMFRTDRVALTTLLQNTEDKNVVSLDDLANFAISSPNPVLAKASQMYLLLFVPGSIQMGLDGGGAWSMLRFYGHLPDEMRAVLMNGGRIGLGNIPGAGRVDLESLVYGSGNHLSVDDGKKKMEDDLPSFMRFSFANFDATDYKTEPTEVAPNGLPADGYVDLKGTTEPFATIVGDNTSPIISMLGALGPEEFALIDLFKSQKGGESMAAMLPTMNKLKIGSRSVMNFTFHLTPQVVVKETLKDHHLDKNAEVVSDKNLPSEFQKLIASKMDALKKSPFGQMGGMFGGAGNTVHP